MFIRFLAKIFPQMKGLSVDVTKLESYLSYYRRRWTSLILLVAAVCIFIFFIVPHIGFDDPTLSSVDDLHLPQSLQCHHRNTIRLDHGRLHLASSRVIVCGLIRDREKHIPRMRQQIEEITQHFADYAIVIVENDSKDRTRPELIRWAQDEKFAGRIHVLGCGNRVNDDRPCNLSLALTRRTPGPDTSRIEKMVQLRNIYMQYIEDRAQLAKFEYVIVEDFDLRTYTYTDGLLSTGFHLSTDPTIDAICASGMHHHRILGRRRYYDPYAHRDEQNQNWTSWYNDRWSTVFRQYPCSTKLVPVQSCFNGRTIYRYRSVKGKRYRMQVDSYQQAICEHVGLNEILDNVYLNSEMIFYIIKNHFW